MQQFGSLIIWTCQGLIRGLVQVPIWTTTFILRKDAKKISYPFKIISIQPSSVIYSFLYLWLKPTTESCRAQTVTKTSQKYLMDCLQTYTLLILFPLGFSHRYRLEQMTDEGLMLIYLSGYKIYFSSFLKINVVVTGRRDQLLRINMDSTMLYLNAQTTYKLVR